ncbi:MAG TPA: amino acid permease [Candidatus Angelobacter sp.]|nr:amino acid permease [Candidatus Angelobacter sp.]
MASQSGSTKPIDELMADSDLPRFRLERPMGRWSLIAIGVGAIVGAGIYSLPGIAASGEHGRLPAGPAIVISLALGCVICLAIGACYAELASLLPLAGSVYTYSYAALGELAAWMTGWILTLEYSLANISLASSFSEQLRIRLADLHILMPNQWSLPVWSGGKWTGAYFNVPAFLIVMLITLILSLGTRAFSRTNMLMVTLKSALILFFVVAGSTLVQPRNWHPFAPGGIRGVLSGGMMIFFVYVGFDCVSVAAEEARQPKRDIPVGILGSVVVSGILYIAVAAVLLGILPYTTLSYGAGASISPIYALAHSGTGAATLGIALAGMLIGTVSVLFVCQYGQTRIWYAMARDGFLPEVFSSLHPTRKIPHWCTWISGASVALCAGLIDLGESVDLAAHGALAAFALVPICVICLRKSQPQRPRPFKAPWMPWLGLASLAPLLVMMASLSRNTWIRFLIWLLIGLAIYMVYGRYHSKRALQAHVQ